MKIKGTTNSYCKVLSTTISGFRAVVRVLITSTSAQEEPCAFHFYMKDSKTQEVISISNNNFWIDRCNNYNNDRNNVDINRYKEIGLDIDISNKNKADMKDCKWYRKFKLLLVNTKTQEVAWESEELEVTSKEIILPSLTNFKLIKEKDYLKALFTLSYKIQEDFNYINSNLKTIFIVRSAYTDQALYTQEFINTKLNTSYLPKTVDIKLPNYTEPIIIELHILNLKDEILRSRTIFYNPEYLGQGFSVKTGEYTKSIASYIKTPEGIKKIIKVG